MKGDTSWKRLPGVDLLRGLAILCVLLNHIHIRLAIAKIPYAKAVPDILMGALRWNGQNGVQIFFAVSGFLITSMSLRRWGRLDRISLREFYTLRFARIAPLLFLLLAVISALDFTGSHWFVVTEKRGGLANALFSALTFHINVTEARLGYLPANWDILWSLSVEEAFYIAFPVACLLLRRELWLTILLAAFIVMGPFARTVWAHNEVWREYSYLGGMDAIAMGCLTAIVVSRTDLRRTRLIVIRIVGLATMAFVLGVRGGLMGMSMTIIAIGTCLVIVSVACRPARAPAVLVPVEWMGRYSYEIYLTHMFVVIGFFSLKLPVAAFFALSIGCAAFAGTMVARLFSEPVNRWLRERLLKPKVHVAVVA